MSAQGCGFPINAAVICGDWSALTSRPFLCPACQAARPPRSCEGCGLAPPDRTTAPYLCKPCEAGYAADLDAERRR